MKNLNDEKEQITVPGIRNDMSIHDVEELILQETEEFDQEHYKFSDLYLVSDNGK